MKIHQIITEELSDREKIQQLAQRNPGLANKMLPFIQQGYDFDVAAEFAKREAQGGGNRDRQDTAGRNLKHDRYYSSNKNMGQGTAQAAKGAADTAKQLATNTDPKQAAQIVKGKLSGASKALRKSGKERLKRVGIPNPNIPFTGD